MLQWTLVGICVFQISVFVFYGQMPRSEIAWSYGSSVFNFFGGSPYCFHNAYTQFTFPPKVQFFASLPTLVICCLFYCSCSDRCKVMSQCGFHLLFPDLWCWVSFHICVGHLYIIFGKNECASPLPICLIRFYFSVAELYEFFVCFGYYPLIR